MREWTREIGIRIALGAQRKDVLSLILVYAGAVMLIGLSAGIAASLSLVRLLASQLYAIKPVDPLTFTAVSLLLLAAGLAASLIPAWRAMRVNPAEALRFE